VASDLERLAWADASPGGGETLGEIFCLTFVKGVDAAEALRRMGGFSDTVAVRTLTEIGDSHTFDHGYPHVVAVVELDGWTVLFEPGGYEGSHLVTALSQGTEVISVLRHDYASPSFEFAVDGTLVVRFDPTFPADRHGSDPDRLVPLMREVGFMTEELDEDSDDYYDQFFDQSEHDTSRSLLLTERLTGVLPTFDVLTGPLTSAEFEPWFSQARKPPARRPGHDGPVDAVAEVQRLAELHGLADTPGLADALTTKPVRITPESPLGQHVRAWLTESRRASWSLNDHGGRHRMTEDQRRRGYDLGWLTAALGAALQEDV
jgi:hypothetical protein